MTLDANRAPADPVGAPSSNGAHDAPTGTDFRALFAAVPACCVALAPDAPRFTIVEASDAYCRAWRTPREAMLGRGFFELFADDAPTADRARRRDAEAGLRASFAAVLRTGAPQRPPVQRVDVVGSDDHVEERYWQPLNAPVLAPDGAVRYIVHQVNDVTDAVLQRGAATPGGLVGASATLVDVTARERAEAALRESEARYRALFESLDEGFCVIEMIVDAAERPVDYRFVETNAAFEEQTGLVDARGRRARELVPGLEPHWVETYGRVASTGESLRFESGSDAMERWFDVYAFRVGPPAERRVALLFKDVSAARLAERERERLLEELEVERARLAYVFQQAPAFLAVLRGPDHVFEMVNDAYYGLVGHRALVGLAVRDALPEVRDQGFIQLLDGVLAEGHPFVGRELSVLLARESGAPPEERFVDFVYLAVVEADGTRSGIIAHGTDVTEQVVARRDVERLLAESEAARADAEAARAEAEAANRAKGEFLAVMSHELRTPLNAIGGYAELLEMGIRGPVTKQQGEDLRRIQTSQRHLLGLINEVLNYAKLETGTVHYDVAEVRVREALAAAEALVAPQARAKGLTLVVADAPPALAARADPEKLRQILVNLLSNAVKFTDRGGRVEISCAAADAGVVVRVHDTGIGIPPDRLEAIFDPFVQVRADLTRPHEGTGLGLAISRDLARGMGGDLTAESALGVGSTLTLTLPGV